MLGRKNSKQVQLNKINLRRSATNATLPEGTPEEARAALTASANALQNMAPVHPQRRDAIALKGDD